MKYGCHAGVIRQKGHLQAQEGKKTIHVQHAGQFNNTSLSKQWTVFNGYSLLLLNTITSKRMRWGGVKRQILQVWQTKKKTHCRWMQFWQDSVHWVERKMMKRAKLMNFRGVCWVSACTLRILRQKVGSTFQIHIWLKHCKPNGQRWKNLDRQAMDNILVW